MFFLAWCERGRPGVVYYSTAERFDYVEGTHAVRFCDQTFPQFRHLLIPASRRLAVAVSLKSGTPTKTPLMQWLKSKLLPKAVQAEPTNEHTHQVAASPWRESSPN